MACHVDQAPRGDLAAGAVSYRDCDLVFPRSGELVMSADCVTTHSPDPDLAGLGGGLVSPVDGCVKVVRFAVRLTEEGYTPIEFSIHVRTEGQAGRLESWIRRRTGRAWCGSGCRQCDSHLGRDDVVVRGVRTR